ncbi:MAG: hypothetical protein J6Y02_01505 [Pseudobutyrivibrio sp.]|nr:hypothetical protein [Pseudobutyrivibrio sp.]
MEEKPLILLIEDFKVSVGDLVNDYVKKVPAVILADSVRDICNQLEDIAKTQYEQTKTQYETSKNEETTE